MIVVIIALGGILFFNALVIVLSVINYKHYNNKREKLPNVSILLAVRNEEKVLVRCLNSLVNLEYPTDKLQILIGNDASQDNTWKIIELYQQRFSFIEAIQITEQVGAQQGKANVLAQLAHQAKGEYFLMTDADMSLPTSWVKGMLAGMNDSTGLAIGITHVDSNKMQDMDWLFSLGMVKVVTDMNRPVTGMGNNMIVTNEAYWEVGGYEKLPFSITEDFELFKHIYNKGYECKHVFQKEVLGRTLPIKGVWNLLNQRKRWTKGAFELPWYMLVLFLFQASYYFLLLILAFAEPLLAFKLLVIKIILQIIFIGTIRRRLELPLKLFSIFAYEVYSFIISIASGIYFLMPIKVKWKGRTY